MNSRSSAAHRTSSPTEGTVLVRLDATVDRVARALAQPKLRIHTVVGPEPSPEAGLPQRQVGA